MGGGVGGGVLEDAPQGLIAPGSPLATEVTRIKAESAPLKRVAFALDLVQDKVRYLYNGMAGGNYTPQKPADTWSLRYGDCKAKTLLLLALLHALDVEAEAAVAPAQAGDLTEGRLPSPGAFDHVIVKATVGGEALRLTRQALEAGVDPIPMIAALAMKLRAMVKVGAAGRGRDADVARAVGMAPWQVERARADLRGWTPEGIATSLLALAEADAAAKGLSRDPVYAVERAVVVVTGARS